MSEPSVPDGDQFGPPVQDGTEDVEMDGDGADANGADGHVVRYV